MSLFVLCGQGEFKKSTWPGRVILSLFLVLGTSGRYVIYDEQDYVDSHAKYIEKTSPRNGSLLCADGAPPGDRRCSAQQVCVNLYTWAVLPFELGVYRCRDNNCGCRDTCKKPDSKPDLCSDGLDCIVEGNTMKDSPRPITSPEGFDELCQGGACWCTGRCGAGSCIAGSLCTQKSVGDSHPKFRSQCLGAGAECKCQKLKEVAEVTNVEGDGNCLYRSISYLVNQQQESEHVEVRAAIATKMCETETWGKILNDYGLLYNLGCDSYSVVSEDLDVDTCENYVKQCFKDKTWGSYDSVFVAAEVYNASFTIVDCTDTTYENCHLGVIYGDASRDTNYWLVRVNDNHYQAAEPKQAKGSPGAVGLGPAGDNAAPGPVG